MSLSGLLDVVTGDPALRQALASPTTSTLDLSGPAGLRPFLVAGLVGRGRTVLAVTATGREAEDLVAALGCLVDGDRVALYPSWETLPHERLSPRADTVGRRLAVLRRLRHPSADDPATGPLDVVVAPVRSLLQPQVPGLGDLEPVALVEGQDVDGGLDAVVRRLVDISYARVELVEKRGEFAVRGGILDVFPPTEEHPVRVEWWGDAVEEVRSFKVADQRSLGKVAHGLWAPPCRELLLTPDVRAQGAAARAGPPRAGRDLHAHRRRHAGRGHGGARARARRRPAAAGRRAARGHQRRRLRPREGAHPRARPGAHQPGVPRGVLGHGGRRRAGADRPRRRRVPVAGRRARARRRDRPAVVDAVALHRRRGPRRRHRRARRQARPGVPRRGAQGRRGPARLGEGRLARRRHDRGPRAGAAAARAARRGRGPGPAVRQPRPRAGRRAPVDRLPGQRLPQRAAEDGAAHRDRPDRHPRRRHQGRQQADAEPPQERRRPGAAAARRRRRARAARRRPVRRDGAAHRAGRDPRVPHPRVRPEQEGPARRPGVRADRPGRARHAVRRRRGAEPGPPRRRRLGQAQGPREEGRQGDRRRPHPAVQRAHVRPRPRLRPGHPVAARARGRLPVRRDARPARGHHRGQGRHGEGGPDGPRHHGRRRLRQDRDRRTGSVQGRAGRQAGRGPRADDAARAAALRHLPRPLPGRSR